MVYTVSLPAVAIAAAAAAFLVFPSTVSAGLYNKNSPVVQLNAKSYRSLIANSNFTSIVEFYAPWCGHCKSLQPAYERAAKNLKGLAKVAAVDCDEEINKAFCGSMGVQGFPTLKIVRPGKNPGRPSIEDYQGPRDAKGIVAAVIEKMPNHVKRIGDKGIGEWLKEDNETAKAILFSTKGVTSALIKSLAIDFLGGIQFAQVRDKEKAVVEMFDIEVFPSLVLLPGGTSPGIPFEGEMKKEAIVKFLSQIMPPNPDPAPRKGGKLDKPVKMAKKKPGKDGEKKTERKTAMKDKALHDESSLTNAESKAPEFTTSATSIILGNPSDSPDPAIKGSAASMPVPVKSKPPQIPKATVEELQKNCLGLKSKTCILVLLPVVTDKAAMPDVAVTALESLAQILDKYAKRKGAFIPFYVAPAAGATSLRKDLGLESDGLEVVAINIRRGWWKRYSQEKYGADEMEGWIDAIRLGEGKKQDVPKVLYKDVNVEEHIEVKVEEKTIKDEL